MEEKKLICEKLYAALEKNTLSNKSFDLYPNRKDYHMCVAFT